MGTTRTEQDEPLAVTDGPGDWQATRAPQTRPGRWWELHPRLLRTVAVVALVWGCAYLGWRLLETGRAANPEAFYVLWFVELYNFTSLVFLAFYGWRWSEPCRPPATPGYRVDVYVATYDETRARSSRPRSRDARRSVTPMRLSSSTTADVPIWSS